MAQDGYKRLARRPRSKYMTEIMSEEEVNEFENPSYGMPFTD